jgi:hypothetical protein
MLNRILFWGVTNGTASVEGENGKDTVAGVIISVKSTNSRECWLSELLHYSSQQTARIKGTACKQRIFIHYESSAYISTESPNFSW